MRLVDERTACLEIHRHVHAYLERRWPGLQFCNYRDSFLRDQDIQLTISLPYAVQLQTENAHVASASAASAGFFMHTWERAIENAEAYAEDEALAEMA